MKMWHHKFIDTNTLSQENVQGNFIEFKVVKISKINLGPNNKFKVKSNTEWIVVDNFYGVDITDPDRIIKLPLKYYDYYRRYTVPNEFKIVEKATMPEEFLQKTRQKIRKQEFISWNTYKEYERLK